DHGAGTENAARNRLARPKIHNSATAFVSVEFHFPGNLLEQPSPHAPYIGACERQYTLGEPAFAVLAVAGAVRDRLGRSKSACTISDGSLWRRFHYGRPGVHDPSTLHYLLSRAAL